MNILTNLLILYMCIVTLILSSALITKMLMTNAVLSVTSCSIVSEVFLS